jgi:hypothetical protein
MPIVELVYALDCPNVSRAREHLVEAFRCVGLAPEWLEHDVNDPGIPSTSGATDPQPCSSMAVTSSTRTDAEPLVAVSIGTAKASSPECRR